MERGINGAGLDREAVERSREKYGSNRITKGKKAGFWRHFLRELGDPVIRVLLIALGCELLLLTQGGSFAETAGILFSILAATFVSTVSGYKAERTLEAMEKQSGRRSARVIRSGELREVDPDDLVVGDLVMLSAGDRVPCDGMLAEGALTVDQSALNGESAEKSKTPGAGRADPADPHALLRGTLVTSGEGRMYVTGVGDGTLYGSVSRELSSREAESGGPLKERLTRLAKQISRMGYAAALLIAAADFLYSFTVNGLRTASAGEIVSELLRALTLGVTVIVVAVPEGLPMMISVVLSANTRKMAADGVIVRRPVGIETAGNMNILFCDKTGTLTGGKLRAEEFITSCGTPYRSLDAIPAEIRETVGLSLVCNNQADWIGSRPAGSNSTDRALLAFAGRGVKKRPVRERIPFDSARKYSSVRLTGGEGTTLIKGAPDVVIPKCAGAVGENGFSAPLDTKAIGAAIADRSERSARMIAFAVSQNGGRPLFLGLCSLRDRPRHGARRAVKELREAGVRVVMLTGDSRETAVAVAKECGIIRSEGKGVITSAELARMDDAEAAAYLTELRVLARALPSDKSRLVRLCSAAGLVCGMTGDGTNDAPALKAAPVGFAMGSGSETAREAGDVVITDDDISSIAKAVLYGRTVFHSIRKFIVFQLTVNFCAVGISLIAPFIGVDTPVTVPQMLWINLIMDTLAGLAFAGEAPRQRYMREGPRPRGEGIVRRSMVSQIVVSGSWTAAVSVFFLRSEAVASRFAGEGELMCGFFCFFVFSGIFAAVNSRTESLNLLYRIAPNKPFMLIMACISAVQILMVFAGGTLFRCVPLTPGQLLFAVGLAAPVIPVDLVRKAAQRLRAKK